MYRIEKFNLLSQYNILIKFSDGTEGKADLSDLVGKGICSIWKDYEEFRKVSIGSSGELIWESGADLCPDSLYMRVTGKKPEDLFPLLREEALHA